MTKRTRRNIKSTIEEIEQSGPPAEWNIYSECRVITEDMVDDNGNTIEEKAPNIEPPEGYEYAGVVPTRSPVVTVRELRPTTDDGSS